MAVPRRFAMPEPGQVLAGKYRIERLLGEGGMAFVFAARDESRGLRAALKVLAPDFARDPELVARFEREAQAVSQLRSPHVVRMYEINATADGLPFIAMELLEGRDLEAELEERKQIPVDEAVDYILQACSAMIEAHAAGIVHRDLKPANLFVDRQTGIRMVKVLDFGISKVFGAAKLTAAGAIMGTVLYMSPEQVRASKDVDERTDIWSLGVILYEILAGRAPFEGSSHEVAGSILSKPVPDIRTLVQVPDGVANALADMLQSDAARRISKMSDVVRVLGPFARPGSPGAHIAAHIARGSNKALQAFTVPLAQGGPPASARTAPPPALARSPAPSQPQLPPAGQTSGGGGGSVIVGVVIGLLAAAGVVFGGFWWFRAHGQPTTIVQPQPQTVQSAELDAGRPPRPASSATP
jgi:eukaryotic-like serine/threonine-protein kinase